MASKKVALITGITGQDGALLAELLLSKDYIVHGVKRRSSLINTDRVDHLYHDPHEAGVNFLLHYGDLTDSTNLIRIVQEVQPDEIYNLAAQSHVQVSFETPEYTANADALGTLRLLEAIRILRLCQKTRFYQASTSELYGKAQAIPQNEATPFYPRSPYAAAKLYAYWITINYREAYGMHASNGILFNHEGPTRAETFVTRKITRAVAAIHLGLAGQALFGQPRCQARLGTRAGLRRWHVAHSATARSRTIMFWRPAMPIRCANSSSAPSPKLASGSAGGDQESTNKGSIKRAAGFLSRSIRVTFVRPRSICLLGDPGKAFKKLGWKHTVTFARLVSEMVASDLTVMKKRGRI